MLQVGKNGLERREIVLHAAVALELARGGVGGRFARHDNLCGLADVHQARRGDSEAEVQPRT